jgi:hypothetical protein
MGRLVRIETETSADRKIVHRIVVMRADKNRRETVSFRMEQDYAVGLHRHMVSEFRWFFYTFETRIDTDDRVCWDIMTHNPRCASVDRLTFSTKLAADAHTRVLFLPLYGTSSDQARLQDLRERERATRPDATVPDFINVGRSLFFIL